MTSLVKTPILTIANQKGGVGKTTTALSLALALLKAGERVLLVDLDPNAHATSLLLKEEEAYRDASDLFKGKFKKADVEETNKKNIGLIAGSRDLLQWESKKLSTKMKYGLRRDLQSLARWTEHTIIIVDTPGTLGSLQLAGLYCADYVIIPAIPDYFSMSAFKQVLQQINSLPEKVLEYIKYGLLFTQCIESQESHKTILDWSRTRLKDILMDVFIPYDLACVDALAEKKTVIEAHSQSESALAYQKLALQLIEQLKPSKERS